MRLQAHLTAEDLFVALSGLTPARIPLDKEDPERCLWLSKPESVVFAGEKDIIITARAQVRWDLLGLTVPVTLRRVSLVVSPRVHEVGDTQTLSWAPRIQEADLTGVPAIVEQSLVSRVNEALAHAEPRMSWNFLETLDFRFALPLSEPKREMLLRALWGSARVTENGLSLTVGWGVDTELSAADARVEVPVAVL